MIEIKMQFASVAEAAAALAALSGAPTVAAAPATADKPNKPPKPAPAASPAASSPTAAPTPAAPAPAPATLPTVAATGETMDYAPIGEKIAKLVAKDRPAAVAILASFANKDDGTPAKKGPQIAPADYPELDRKLTEALADDLT